MHTTVASISHNLGTTHKLSVFLNDARKYFERALAIDKATYIATHPDVRPDEDALGEVLKGIGPTDGTQIHTNEKREGRKAGWEWEFLLRVLWSCVVYRGERRYYARLFKSGSRY